MDEHLAGCESVLLRLTEDSVKMLQHAVHSGIAHDTQQVQPRSRPGFHAVDCAPPCRVGREPLF
jgi:hypothetical protein